MSDKSMFPTISKENTGDEKKLDTMEILPKQINDIVAPSAGQQQGRGPETVFSYIGTKKQMFPNFAIPVFGIDVGGHSIKVVEVRKGLKNLRLTSVKVVEIYPDGPPQDGKNELFSEQKLEALKTALIGFKLSKARIVASIGGNAVIVRQIRLPSISSRKIESAIKWEAKRYLPYEINEMVFDTKILKENRADNNMDVLLVAIKKNVLSGLTRFFKDAGITPDVVDAGPLALINALTNTKRLDEEETVAFLDIGATVSTLSIFGPNGPLFSRTFSISGENFTNKIRKQLNISYSEAERIKKTDASVFEILRSLFDKLISDIHQTFIYYSSLSTRKQVDRLIISGGGAFLPKQVNYLSTELNIDAEILNPLRGIAMDRDLSQQKREVNKLSPQLTHAIGLALR